MILILDFQYNPLASEIKNCAGNYERQTLIGIYLELLSLPFIGSCPKCRFYF
jgi:hypothetical protein